MIGAPKQDNTRQTLNVDGLSCRAWNASRGRRLLAWLQPIDNAIHLYSTFTCISKTSDHSSLSQPYDSQTSIKPQDNADLSVHAHTPSSSSLTNKPQQDAALHSNTTNDVELNFSKRGHVQKDQGIFFKGAFVLFFATRLSSGLGALFSSQGNGSVSRFGEMHRLDRSTGLDLVLTRE